MDVIGKFYDFFAQGFQYLADHWGDRISPFFFEHLRIIGISLVVAILIAFPLGLLISRFRWLATPVLGFLGILYTVPSLAFLAFLVPVLGLTPVTTIVVLIVYCQTMLVRNITLGFWGIDPSIIEAAVGMGMSRWQVLWRVEFPLALPVMVAGMRIATLAIISIATVGAWAGAETLGKLFLDDNPRKIAAGIICIVAMAIVADQLYRLIERAASAYRRTPAPARTRKAVPVVAKT